MKRFLSIVAVIAILTFGTYQVAQADVTGVFTIDLTLSPQTNSQEAVPFFFDMQTNLQVFVTVSGLIFGMDLGFGVTGLEFAIISLGTNLGALALRDEFVFAPPFGCSAPTWLGMADNSDGGIAGQCTGTFVGPIGSSDSVNNDAGIAFVKKRVDLQLDIAGISFGVLALFEDVDFPDIHGAKSTSLIDEADGSDHEHDHFRTTDLYFVGANDTIVDNQTPSFGFGTVLTVTGQTVSGITVTGITGICANNMLKNHIKKRTFVGEVNKGCVREDGPLFAFDIEKLHIEGVRIGGVNLSQWLTFVPLKPVSSTFEISFSLAGLADVKSTFSSVDLTTFTINSIVLSLATSNFTLVLEDVDADLQFDRSTAKLTLTLNANQNPAGFVSTTVAERGIGATLQEFELTVTRSALTIALTTTLKGNGNGLNWSSTVFALSTELDAITFGSNVVFNTVGLQTSSLNMTINF